MSLHFTPLRQSTYLIERLWDLWCIFSVVGIWPRFIEPNIVLSSHHTLPIENLPQELEGIRIVQISDLHISSQTSQLYLDFIAQKIRKEKPDLIVFTGDAICYAQLERKELLEGFLKKLSAPLGSYFILGNHDYKEYVSLSDEGTFCIMKDKTPPLIRGLKRLFSSKNEPKEDVVGKPIALHEELLSIFSKAGFELLHNKTIQVGTGRKYLNITGLGDLMAGQMCPHEAFSFHAREHPTVVLSHNPDSYPYLKAYPGDLYLFGHTHGGQVNLPFIWEKVTPLKNKQLKSGLVVDENRYLYINRGLGSTFAFRWFAPPEIAQFTLVQKKESTERLFSDLFFEKKKASDALPSCEIS